MKRRTFKLVSEECNVRKRHKNVKFITKQSSYWENQKTLEQENGF